MQVRTTALKLAGAAMITVAIVPWLGGASANASAADDADCATRPAEVPVSATCVLLDENTGNDPALHGETWAWRDAGNDLHVNAYPTAALDGGDPVQLCVRESGPYAADFKCLGNDPTRVFVGADLTLVVDLDGLGITAGDPVYYSIHVNQGGRTTVSSGTGGSIPTETTSSAPPTTTSAPPTTTSAPPTTTSAPPTTTSAPVTTTAAVSGSVVTTAGQTAGAVSVLPTKAGSTSDEETVAAEEADDTEVLGTEAAAALPHTGSDLPVAALVVLSTGLLLGGGALVLLPGLAVEKGTRRH